MALQTANQFQLTPNIGGAITQGINTGIGIKQAQQRTQLANQQQTQFEQGQQDRVSQLETQKQTAMLQGAANAAVAIRNLPDVQSKINFSRKRIAEINSKPDGDSSDTQEVLDLYESGQIEKADALINSFVKTSVDTGLIKAPTVEKFSSLQQKVAAEGLDPNTPAGQARAREITQGTRTDPSLKPSDQQVLNKANEGQLASASFAARVLSANENLTELENTPGFNPTSIQTAILQALPGGNLVLSENDQRYAQSKLDFITAILRKESGAAIGQDELEKEDRKFFPQVGDKPAVIKQKTLGRKRTFENLKNQSKGVFDIQNKSKHKTGALSKAEQSELQQLRAELGQ